MVRPGVICGFFLLCQGKVDALAQYFPSKLLSVLYDFEWVEATSFVKELHASAMIFISFICVRACGFISGVLFSFLEVFLER